MFDGFHAELKLLVLPWENRNRIQCETTASIYVHCYRHKFRLCRYKKSILNRRNANSNQLQMDKSTLIIIIYQIVIAINNLCHIGVNLIFIKCPLRHIQPSAITLKPLKVMCIILNILLQWVGYSKQHVISLIT